MKKYFVKNVNLVVGMGCFLLCVFLIIVPNAAAQNTSLIASDTISVDRAKMLGYVENLLTTNPKFPPMMRRTIEWGEIKKNKNQYTIRYQCEAVAINSKECLVYCWDFTFDEVGNFVTYNRVSGFPKRPLKPFLKIADEAEKKALKAPPKENAPEVKVSQADFKDSAIAYEKALELVKNGDYAAAEVLFNEAFKKNPNNYMALLGLGNAQFKQHLFEDAQTTFLKCTKLRPRDARPLEMLGMIAKEDGNEEKMIEWWEKSIEVDKQASIALKELGTYYAERGDIQKALIYFRSYLKTNSQDAEIKAAVEKLKNKNTNE
jgi:TolA-binding protein